jgi:hypothetical protein
MNTTQLRLIRFFLYSAGALLLVTAAAKLVSAGGHAKVLFKQDPLLGLTFQQVFRIAGSVEVLVALVCLFGKRLVLRVGAVAWLVTSFLLYRAGLLWIGYEKPCTCLGNLSDALHISPETVDIAMKVVLAYLIFGSYLASILLWKQNRKTRTLLTEEGSSPERTQINTAS